jgi:hypothetical protein
MDSEITCALPTRPAVIELWNNSRGTDYYELERMQNCRIFPFFPSPLFLFLENEKGGWALCVWMIKRKSSSSAHNYSRVLYSRDSLSLCQHVGISPVLSSHSRASITQRHSSSSSSVNTKGHHARGRRRQQPNKKNKKGGTYYTHRRKRERKIKEKKGESRNPISWHPQCWMLDAGWRWSSDDCVCVVLKHWRRYTTGYIVDPNFVFFFFLLIFFFSLAALWCIIWFNYLLLRKESRESGARRRRRQLSFTHVIELLDESRQTS